MTCLEADLESSLEENTEALVELHLDAIQEERFWAGRVWNPFFVGYSQYDYPLRVVAVHADKDTVRLGLYNESDASKREVVVERIQVDGVDAEIGDGNPLAIRPDRHEYIEDVEFVDLPVQFMNHQSRIDIDYRLRSISGAVADSIWTLSVLVDDRLDRPVGILGGPTLPGCASLCHEGLRPAMSFDQLFLAAHQIRCSAPDWPLYARLVGGSPLSRIKRVGALCDLVVFDVPSYFRSQDTDPLPRVLEFLSTASRELRTPFVLSVGPDIGGALSPEEAEWLALAAIGHGSKGVLFRCPPTQSPASENECGAAVQRSMTSLSSLRPFIASAYPADLNVVCDSSGVDVGTLIAGPDRILVVVLNQWCSRASTDGHLPFAAVRREGIRLTFDLGDAWNRATARDLGTGRSIPLVQPGLSASTFELPPFETGMVIALERSASVESSASSIALSPDARVRRPDVELKSSPYVNLGYTPPGLPAEVELLALNGLDAALPVRIEQLTPDRDAHVTSSTTSLPPGEVSTISIALTPATKTLSKVCAVRVFVSENALCDMYVTYASMRNLSVEPGYLDWGIADRHTIRSPKQVRLDGRDRGQFAIREIRSDSVPVDVEIAKDGQSFLITPRPETNGLFIGRLRILTASDDGSTEELEMRYSGDYAGAFHVAPSKLVIFDSGHPVERTVRIASVDKRSYRLTVPDVPGMSIEPPGDEFRPVHTLRLLIQPSELAESRVLRFQCEQHEGHSETVELPFDVVRASAAKTAAGADVWEEGPTDTHRDQREVRAAALATVDWLRRIHLASPASPWGRMHHLLMYPVGSDSEASPQVPPRLVADAITTSADSFGPVFELRSGLPSPRKAPRPFIAEDHRDQYLHIFSVVNLPRDAAISVNADHYTVDDLLKRSLHESRTTGDVSWTVSAYTHYLAPRHVWTNKFGQSMHLGRLVEYLLENDSNVCGGSHRHFALARVARCARSDPALAHFDDAISQELHAALEDARLKQLPSGLLQHPQNTGDAVLFTGHTLEWMSIALEPEALREPWIVKMVQALVGSLEHRCGSVGEFDVTDVSDAQSWGAVTHAISALSRWVEATRGNNTDSTYTSQTVERTAP